MYCHCVPVFCLYFVLLLRHTIVCEWIRSIALVVDAWLVFNIVVVNHELRHNMLHDYFSMLASFGLSNSRVRCLVCWVGSIQQALPCRTSRCFTNTELWPGTKNSPWYCNSFRYTFLESGGVVFLEKFQTFHTSTSIHYSSFQNVCMKTLCPLIINTRACLGIRLIILACEFVSCLPTAVEFVHEPTNSIFSCPLPLK